MKVSVLVENTSSRKDILPEHGLSLYLETLKHTLLFDMGQSNLFSQNAHKMGLNLQNVDAAFVSHGHYDHGGGLKTFLQKNKTAPVYLNRHAFEVHSKNFEGGQKYIGLDQKLSQNERFCFVDEELVLDDELKLYSCGGRSCPYSVDSFGLTMIQDGNFIPDDFRHEQYLMIEENGKRILVSGCSHRGILNIMEWFHPDILIGGFHFMKLDPHGAGKEQLSKAADLLNHYPTQYYTCHCTGLEQYDFLKQRMGNKLHYLSGGDCVTL